MKTLINDSIEDLQEALKSNADLQKKFGISQGLACLLSYLPRK